MLISATLPPSVLKCSRQYRAQDKPWYRLGHAIVLAYIVIGFCSSFLMRIFLQRENGRRGLGERDEIIGDPSTSTKERPVYENVEAVKVSKGDYWSGFRYTL